MTTFLQLLTPILIHLKLNCLVRNVVGDFKMLMLTYEKSNNNPLDMPVKISTFLEKVHVNSFNDTYFQIYFTFKMKEIKKIFISQL